MSRIQTRIQYESCMLKEIARKYEVPLAEVSRLYPPKSFANEWWTYALEAFESGGYFSPQHWNRLEDWQRRAVGRTKRALKPPAAPGIDFFTKPPVDAA